jgi:glycosyltransferase involved in cell wall biosynthesis
VVKDRIGTPEVSVVIPTIDVLSERVKRCVKSIRACTGADHELLVVDNHTPHQGFTAPANAGIRAAQGAYVVVMNDDVEVQDRWWPPLKQRLDEGAYAVLPEGATPPVDILNFAASCIAFSRDAIDRVGHSAHDFFDPQFKIWFQDTDLLLELCRLGKPPVLVEGSRIVHDRGQTIRNQADRWQDRSLKDWVDEQIARDRQAFFTKWPGGRRGAVAQELVRILGDNNAGAK